jgi:hypothetical protein
MIEDGCDRLARANGNTRTNEEAVETPHDSEVQPECRSREQSPTTEECAGVPSNDSPDILAIERSNRGQFLLTTNQWLGVGAGLAAVAVSVYYGYTQLRLQKWQAENDFYWNCFQVTHPYSTTIIPYADILRLLSRTTRTLHRLVRKHFWIPPSFRILTSGILML